MSGDVRLHFATQSGAVRASDLRPVHVEGEQGLSRPYEYRIRLRSELDGGVPPDAVVDMLRQPAHVEFGADGAITEVHGIITDVELQPMTELSRSEYLLVLRPTLWRASLAYTSRVFQDVTVADIASAVLEQHEVRCELRLDATYPTREYVVQYQESDLDFLHRQLEHWGIFYFFEQSQDG